MKHLFILTVLAVFSVNLAIASESVGETTTDCPMMREQNERLNPKANINVVVEQPKSSVRAVAQ